LKILKKALSIALAASLILSVATACNKNPDDKKDGENETENEIDYSEYGEFEYGPGLNDDGFIEGIAVLDYLTLFDYKGFEIPEGVRKVTSDEVNERYEYVKSNKYPKEEDRILDRAIEKGDLVNIDYLGSVDGEEFSGGNTRVFDDNGSNVTAGGNEFVDDFLTQIIGSLPGDTLEVNVTFPDDYNNEMLAGQDALFIVDINYIIDVDKMKKEVRDEMGIDSVKKYIMDFIESYNVEIPESFVELLKQNSLNYYAQNAKEMGLSVNDYVTQQLEIESIEALLAEENDALLKNARTQFIIQAIAEDINLKVSEDDVRDFLINLETDVEYVIELYNMRYLKQLVMQDMVLNLIVENAVYLGNDNDDDDADDSDDKDENEDDEEDADDDDAGNEGDDNDETTTADNEE